MILLIVISHRLENIVDADYIYLLDEGIVIEKGNHKNLINMNKEYALLYKTQKALETGYVRD